MMYLFVKHRIIAIGIILVSVGTVMLPVGLDFENARRLCEFPNGLQFPPGNERFIPNTIITSTCPVSRDIGQDLALWTQFIAQGSGETIAIPVHIEVRDPNNKILVDQDFNDENIVIQIKPQLHGNYTATIRSLEDPNNRITVGTPRIYYAFGYLVPLTTNAYDGVYNPVGTAIQVMLIVGSILIPAGIIMSIYGAVKAARSSLK